MNQFLATSNTDFCGIGIPSVQYNQDKHPHSTLKAFNDFIGQFEFCYNAKYPQPSRNATENSISKWKASNSNYKPADEDVETIQNEWVSKVKVRKLFFHLFVLLSNSMFVYKIGKLLKLIQRFWKIVNRTIFGGNENILKPYGKLSYTKFWISTYRSVT